MRSRLAIIITIALVLIVLVLLNAASYVSVKQEADSELSPDRSTYNAGPTGTRALYDLLDETNQQVMRWRDTPEALLKNTGGAARPKTFVVVGETRVGFDGNETGDLLRWVAQGGRLVLIDRQPDVRLLPASGNWYVSTQLVKLPAFDPSLGNPDEMTKGVSPVSPAQPTALTQGVEKVLPSNYAALIKVAAAEAKPSPSPSPSASPAARAKVTAHVAAQRTPSPSASPARTSRPTIREEVTIDEDDPPPPPTGEPTVAEPRRGRVEYVPPPDAPQSPAKTISPAPVVHLSDYRGALLVDYAHGQGRIIILSDPFIVANKGINKEDNLRLAVNLLASGGGLIAFDEYHQGHRTSQNELFTYFAGTPVLAMLAQLGLIVLAVLWTSGRRFARPLPVPQVDRRSSLEFVASMAELQQRARAYDLAIENIYQRIRRVLARYAGVDSNSPRALIAAGVAARSSKLDRQQLETLMFECEEAINGAPIDGKKSLSLIAQLREVERTLGLRMRHRDIRQAKER